METLLSSTTPHPIFTLEFPLMLPDYPKVKERLMGMFLERMRRVEMVRLGFLGGMQETLIQEGRRSSLHREDGSSQDVEMKSIHVSEFLNVDYRTLEDLDIADLFRFFDRLAMALADAKGKHGFEVLTSELGKVGNVESSQKPTHEKLLSAFEKMEFDFVNGQPILPEFVANPKEKTLMDSALKSILETPELKRRYDFIMFQKREQYRDREVARKLVE